MTWPCMSVILTRVLLKVARIFAMPVTMFLEPLALTIFFPARSSASSSAAVGAAAAAGAAPSAALGASPTAAAAVAAFLDALGAGWPSPADLTAGFSAPAAASGFSFLGAAFFFVSSAIASVKVDCSNQNQSA